MNGALDLVHTQPPSDLLMPALSQLLTTAVYGVGAVFFIGYALWLARRERSSLPLLFLAGALLTIFLEPVVDLLGNAVHPQIGQLNLLTTNGHPVPWAVLIGYVWYFAAAPLLCWRQLQERSLTREFVWKAFATVVASAAIVEQIPLAFGVWVYYGEQGLKLGLMPAWWIFANTAAVMVPFLLLYKLLPQLQGWRQALVPLLMPMGAFMGHAGAAWPMYNVLGTDTVNLSPLLLHGTSLASIGLSLLLVWAVMLMADVPLRSVKLSSQLAPRRLHANQSR